MNEQKNILVMGATGKQGGAVAGELLAHGFAVRAMTRKPGSDKAKALHELGAEIIQGDFDDSASLERAMEGVWGVFAMQNTWEAGVEKEEAQGKRIAHIAKKTGVEHFVYTSVGSAQRSTGIPHFDNKWRIEERVRELGFPSHTVIRPVFFMENFLLPDMKKSLENGKLAMGLRPNTVLQMIAVADIGKYGLWAFENHRALNGRAVDIAGDAKSMSETAKVIGNAAGKSVEFVSIPVEDVRKFSEDYAIMLEWFERVGYNVDIDDTAKESGIRPTRLPEWAAKIDWS